MSFEKWAQRYLTPDQAESVSRAIEKAEAKTNGEIVVMLVQRSTVVGHVPALLTLLFALLILACEVTAWNPLHGFWVWLAPSILIMGFYFLAVPLSRSRVLQRWLTSRQDQAFQVQKRAELEFYQSRLNRTAGATAVLLFLSVMERRAVVLADSGISSRLPSSTWQDVVEALVGSIRSGKMSEGLCTAVEKCGDHLQTHFPALTHNVDELPNQLIIKP